MGYEIRIVTVTEGGTDAATFSGDVVCRAGSCKATYRQEGDTSELLFRRSSLIMKRRGEVNLTAMFSPERETVLTAEFAGNSTKIPIKTLGYRFSISQTIFSTLDYCYLLGSRPLYFHLEISISEVS